MSNVIINNVEAIGTLQATHKIPIGNTNDAAATATVGQLEEYMESNITLDYSRIENRPAIGTGTLTIQSNGSDLGTFGANSSSNATVNVIVPTKVSDLSNDSGYITSSALTGYLPLTGGTMSNNNLVSNLNAQYLDGFSSTNMGYSNIIVAGLVTDTESTASSVSDPFINQLRRNSSGSLYVSGHIQLVGGSNVTVTGEAGVITISSTGGGSQTIGDATLTLQKNGTSVGTFTANATTDATVNIAVPEVWYGTQAEYNALVSKSSTTTYYITDGGFSYNDLTDKPTIPAAQVQADWSESDSTSMAYILNKPTIVAPVQSDWREVDSTSLAYIANKPNIPSVGNSTLTIQKNGVTAGTFTANATTDSTVNITVPTSYSDLGVSTETWTMEDENGNTITRTVCVINS